MDANGHYPYSAEPGSSNEPPDTIMIEQLRHLVRLLDQSDVSEVEVKQAGQGMRLVLRKARADENSYPIIAPPTTAVDAALPEAETTHFVVSSLVGIFHSWAKPKGGALVALGDRVKVGQVVGTIQSLNVINEVESLVEGRVTEILVQDGQPVEYGQPLMTIESSEEA